MPASTSTRFTLAQAKASARLPKSVMSGHTNTPTIHALRKQPNRNSPTAPAPAASTFKSNAHHASTASSVNSAPPRTMPTSQDPTVRWRMPMGARNWCLMDFDQTSISTAYATSSWQTLTTDSAIVPISTNDACAGVRPRNFVMSPMESTPTMGQNSSSKKKKTLREAMRALRTTTAHTARRSARQLNEDLLQLRLAHAHVAHGHALGEQLPQQVGQPLLGVVHRALRPAVVRRAAQHARGLRQPRRRRRLQPQRDHVAEADAPLQLVGRAGVQDPARLDEGHLVAQLLGLAHVVRRQQNRHAALAAQGRDVRAHAHRHVGIEPQRRLVEEEQLGIVDERLRQRDALLQPGGQLAVRHTAVLR